jgi:ubiquinone/menaquinone biosynthesis C-methylase UbiE
MRQRAKVIPAASGQVLEIGFGSGLNLPFYDGARVRHLWALEPAEEMWSLGREKASRSPLPVELLRAPAEEIPLGTASVDTVVITYTLCTIPDVAKALAQVARVLRRDGCLLFCEHGRAPDESTRRWQRRIGPRWKKLGGGCHRDCESDTLYLPGWKPASLNCCGRAVPCA